MKDIIEQELLKAIKNSKGSINTISKRLGVAWHTAKKAIENNENAQIAIQDEKEIFKDRCEAVVYEKVIKEKDINTAKWYLSTIGKDRGYTEKQELEHSGNIKIIEIPERKNKNE